MIAARASGRLFVIIIGVIGTTAVTALGQGATRDLSGFSGAGNTFVVALAIDVPAGVNVVGVEDAPPSGWVASAISDGGSWDSGTEKVKWVFLTEPFPTALTYDVAPPEDAQGHLCFAGTISFDGPSVPIEGDGCLAVGIPAVSGIGLAVFAALLLVAACVMAVRRRKTGGVGIEGSAVRG